MFRLLIFCFVIILSNTVTAVLCKQSKIFLFLVYFVEERRLMNLEMTPLKLKLPVTNYFYLDKNEEEDGKKAAAQFEALEKGNDLPEKEPIKA